MKSPILTVQLLILSRSLSRGDLSALESSKLRPLSLLARAGPVKFTPAAIPQGNRPLFLAR